MSCIDRRRFLGWGLQLPAAALLADTALAACVDPEELSDSVIGMRESLDYTDASADANAVCRGCSFFKPQNPGDACGYCEVLQGPVSATGHCVSWTKRA